MIVLGVQATQAPFEEGVNILLIPVSLFTHTELHAKWEHEDIPSELNESSTSGIATQFYGIDPDAATVSPYVEGLVIKGLQQDDYVTVQEAQAILNYILKNETGEVIYNYFICDTVGEVERLGLAEDILNLTPFDASGMENDPIGNLYDQP